jgi:hypothetical protein
MPTAGNSVAFTVGTGLDYTPGETVVVYNTGSNYFFGTIDSYNSGTGAITVTSNFTFG